MAYQPSVTNGGTVADALDNFDMMDKLIDFIDGTTAGEAGLTLPVGERWTVLKDEMIGDDRYVYLKGPGLAAVDSIHVNIRVYSVGGNNLHNWEIRGATGFDNGQSFANQPGISNVQSYFTMANTAMPFWFVVSGRRIIIVAQTAGSVCYACYLGFYMPYATPAQFPYPMYNGGSTHSPTVNYLTTNYQIGNFYDGPVHSTLALNQASAQLRDVNGVWKHWGGFSQTSSGTRPSAPYSPNKISPIDSFGIRGYGMVESPSGLFVILPFIMWTDADGGNIYGELDGAFFSPLGLVGKKFPDTLTEGGDTYLVVNNAYRTSEANALIRLK